MPTYKFSYFKGQGLGEIARYLFALGDVEYEDNRLAGETWQAYKPSTPMGQMPVLEVDGVMICQARAIEGYVAKLVGRAGKTDLDYARCAMIADCIFSDTMKPVGAAYGEQDADKKKAMFEKYGNETIHEYLPKLNKMISAKGYFVGDELTWPDISLYHFIKMTPTFGVPEFKLDDYANIRALVKQVGEHPKIKEWQAKRPQPQ